MNTSLSARWNSGTVREWFCLFAVTLIYGLHALLFFSVLLDDPFITFRYSRNLAEGLGLVWNAGEPPVEGYTTTLWMLLGALSIKFGIFPMLMGKMAGVISVIAMLYLMIRHTRQWIPDLTGRFALALLAALSSDIAFHSVTGMENAFFMLLSFGWCLALAGTRNRMGPSKFLSPALLSALLCLVRPEGHICFFLTLLYIIITASEDRPKSLQLVLFVFLILVAPVHLFRLTYFGDLLPNTYYAKHTGGVWIRDLIEGLFYLGTTFAPTAPFFLLSVLYIHHKKRNSWDVVMALLISIFLAYTIKVGGDDRSAFPLCRLLLPVIPVLYLLSCAYLSGLIPNAANRALVLVMTILTSAALHFPSWAHHRLLLHNIEEKTTTRAVFERAREHWHYLLKPEISDLSKKFLQETPAGEVLAMPWAGRIPYETRLPVIDTAGLNDRHIARIPKQDSGILVKGDSHYVLSRQPYWICDGFGKLRSFSIEQISAMSDKELKSYGVSTQAGRMLLKNPKLAASYAVEPSFNQRNHLICFKRITEKQ